MKTSPHLENSPPNPTDHTGKERPETPVGLELDQDRDADKKQVLLESAPESDRWNPVPGSKEVEFPVNASVDEDGEGRSVREQLVEEGAADAALDSRKQSSRSND
jgi:hypothetical protein